MAYEMLRSSCVSTTSMLALCPRPIRGESLLSWVDQVGSDFDITRAEATRALGLHGRPSDVIRLVRQEFGLPVKGKSWRTAFEGGSQLGNRMVRIGDQCLDLVEVRSGLARDELRSMTAEVGFASRVVAGWLSPPAYGTYFGIPPFQTHYSAVCPHCAAETGGRRQLNWRLAVMPFCPRRRCYLLSCCRCGAQTQPSNGLIHRRLLCDRCILGLRCGLTIADLPTIEVTDRTPVEAVLRIVLSCKDLHSQELDWMLRLTLCAGSEELVDGADPEVYDAFSWFCRARDTQWDRRQDWDRWLYDTFRIDSADEKLVMAAATRVAATMVFADDLDDQVEWFCRVAQPRWDVLMRNPRLLGFRAPGRLELAFQAHGKPRGPGL